MAFLKKQYEVKYPTFSNIVPDYKYNEVTGIVEEVGKIDLQEKINSCRVNCLDYILDQYLENGNSVNDLFKVSVDVSDDIADCSQPLDDIMYQNDVMNLMDELKDKYGASDMSNDDFIKYLSDEKIKIDTYINEKTHAKEGDINES
ncbi:hypothetical protein [Capybara microvirus Cap3_SP_554]|nr:hypothetical protein [Capybara microvirus Cap3_SP_554]